MITVSLPTLQASCPGGMTKASPDSISASEPITADLLEGSLQAVPFVPSMAPSTQPALVLGGASLCATLAILIVGARQPGCAFFDWTFPAILAVQICFALAAGFATGYRRPHNREPLKAGLGTSLVAGLSRFIFFVVAP